MNVPNAAREWKPSNAISSPLGAAGDLDNEVTVNVIEVLNASRC